jgi:hypothetical protein
LVALAVAPPVNKNQKSDVPTFPLAVSMVVDLLDDKLLMLGFALRANRIPIAKDILAEIDQIDQLLRDHADLLLACDCGDRLDELMNSVNSIVESEVRTLPGELGHILGKRKRRRASMGKQFAKLLTKGRNALGAGTSAAKATVGA